MPRATTTVICLPHVVKLQVPTTLDNITVSFEPKCQGPVAIEISLITKLPELASITHASPTVQEPIINATKNNSTHRAKLKPGDVTLVNSGSLHNINCVPLAAGLVPACLDNKCDVPSMHSSNSMDFMPNMQELSAGCNTDHVPTGDSWVESAGNAIQPLQPHDIPDDVEKTSLAIKNIPPGSPFTYYTPPRTLGCSYTLDSFTLSKSFDPVSTQVMCECWAAIQDSLTTGQESNRKHHIPLFSEDSSPVRPPKHSHK
ncbi:hypothetical protein V8B97DRAFT_1914943 [Scleroderma yunnanense]